MQRSDSSKRSPAVAMLATHLPSLDVPLVNNLVTSRIARQSQGFQSLHADRRPSRRQEQTGTVTTTNESSSTLVQRLATLSRDHERTGNTRAPLPEHHQQGTDHDCRVSALCPVRNSVLDTCKWAVQHMMDVSHHCRCQVWTEISRCCAIVACGWCVAQTENEKMKKKTKHEKVEIFQDFQAKNSTISRVCRCCCNFFQKNPQRFPCCFWNVSFSLRNQQPIL